SGGHPPRTQISACDTGADELALRDLGACHDHGHEWADLRTNVVRVAVDGRSRETGADGRPAEHRKGPRTSAHLSRSAARVATSKRQNDLDVRAAGSRDRVKPTTVQRNRPPYDREPMPVSRIPPRPPAPPPGPGETGPPLGHGDAHDFVLQRTREHDESAAVVQA